MTLSTKIKCPYCGHERNLVVDSTAGQEISLCCPEDGGCDIMYAVFYRASLSATTYVIGTEEERTRKEGADNDAETGERTQ